MGSQDITHNPSFYFSIGAQVVVTLVLLGLVIVGIAVAIRAKTGRGKGCGIVMAVAFALQACLAAFFFLISFFAGLESSSSSQPRTIHAKDGSCEISVPRSWVESPDLSSEGVLAAKDLTGSEYVVVYVHSKQDYVGNLNDFAQDHTDSVREKLKTPQVEAPATISINGKPAVRQVVRGEIDHLRITYRITYFEGQNNFYRVFCWSLESKAAGFTGDFDKIAGSFREQKVISNQ
jgi:hypothetical protein